VRDALTDLGHEVIYVDPIEGDGVVVKAAEAADIILPILHGAGGEDGEIQSLLEFRIQG
jgi:D-alanine-D-alanine ligase-like ATP-grasp enzyme